MKGPEQMRHMPKIMQIDEILAFTGIICSIFAFICLFLYILFAAPKYEFHSSEMDMLLAKGGVWTLNTFFFTQIWHVKYIVWLKAVLYDLCTL